MSHSAHSVVTNDNIDCLIKIFLGTCHKFDSTFGLNDKSNPFWYRKSNFVSLLNLKDQIEHYGPVYLYWEGVRERYIQHIKPILKNKRKTVSYLTTKLTHLLQRHALEKMSSDSQSHLNISPTLYNNITIFASLSTLEKAINNHESMIVVLHKKEHHCCIATTRMDDMFVCHELKFNDHCGYHVSNLWFAPVSIGPPISKPFTSKDDVLNNSADIDRKSTRLNSSHP